MMQNCTKLTGDAWGYDAEDLVSQRGCLCPSVPKAQVCSSGLERAATWGVTNYSTCSGSATRARLVYSKTSYVKARFPNLHV